MNKALVFAPFLGLWLALGGCTTAAGPSEVTRFHLDQPIAPGRVAIVPGDPRFADSLEFRDQAAAVGAELARLGFTVADPASAELNAVVDVQRGARADPGGGSGLSIGLGGGGFSGGRHGGLGLGGGVSVPIGRGRSHQIVSTRMSVQLKRKSEGTVIWEGRAVTEARDSRPEAAPDVAVRKLAAAMFQGFPGESGRTIAVK